MVHIIVFLIIIVWSSRNSSYCKNLSTIFFIKFSCALQSLPTNVIVQTYLFIVSQRISKHFKPIGFFHPFLFFFHFCFQLCNSLNRCLRMKKENNISLDCPFGCCPFCLINRQNLFHIKFIYKVF